MLEPRDYFEAKEHSIKSLLESDNKIFHIPAYQRNFAWTSHELTQFWEDLKLVVEESYDSENYTVKVYKPHFFGTILLTKSDNKFEVTDGQQRLTASTILLKTFRDVSLRITNAQDQSGINSLITPLIQKSSYGEPYQQRLQLDSRINDFFKKYILCSNTADEREEYLQLNPITKNTAISRLKEAYDYFENRLVEEFPINMPEKELLEKLKCFIHSFTRLFVVLQLVANKSETAYKIFGTINNRGRDLTDSDIIKNELFMFAHEKEKGEVKERWDNIIDTIENEDLTEYIRFQYSSSINTVKPVDLYKAITTHISTNSSVTALSYLEKLSTEAEWYARVNLIGGQFWPENISEQLRSLKENLDVSHSIPLLLTGAIIYNQNLRQFERLVNATIVFCFRYFTIGRNSVSNLEREIGNMSRSLRSPENFRNLTQSQIDSLPAYKHIVDIDSLIVYMRSLTEDKRFENQFQEFSTKSSPLAFYILKELEKSYVSGVQPLPHGIQQHIEHVMPKNPSRVSSRQHEWSHVRNLSEYKENVFKLGNLLILESNINQNVSNSDFDSKKAEYQKSGLYYPKQISNENVWDFYKITSRQKQMAKQAVQIWNYV